MVRCRDARAQNQFVVVWAAAGAARHVDYNIASREAWREKALQDNFGGRGVSSGGIMLVGFKRVTR